MKKLLTAALMSIFVLLTVNSVQATNFTFGDDETIYWDTWANSTADDSKDTIGRPDITGGGGEMTNIENGILTNLYFKYTGSMSGLELGDVFIDATSDGYWDYVLSGGSVYSLAAGSLSAAKGVNDASYINTDDVGWTVDYRNDHPYAVTDEYLNASGTVIGQYLLTTTTEKFDFDIFSEELKLTLSDFFTVSVTPNCANDVFVGQTPEPATMLLLGSGLVGLAGLRRKRFLKK